MWALTAPAEEIPLVILLGPAGCAKTFLSLAAGLDGTYQTQRRSDSEYIKLLISRPTAQSFEDIGYLPGDLNDKLFNLYQSFYDNIEVLLSGNSRDMEDHQQVQTQMQDMFDDGVIEVCGLNFIRGRSLMNTYMICDEAQNASRTMIRDVITRAGIGTKLVIAGDPSQIDVPTLDKRNNGLVYAAEHMKGSPLCAIIQFDSGSSVRSPLAKEAIQCMKG
jgi:PhoH-like ATPase